MFGKILLTLRIEITNSQSKACVLSFNLFQIVENSLISVFLLKCFSSFSCWTSTLLSKFRKKVYSAPVTGSNLLVKILWETDRGLSLVLFY